MLWNSLDTEHVVKWFGGTTVCQISLAGQKSRLKGHLAFAQWVLCHCVTATSGTHRNCSHQPNGERMYLLGLCIHFQWPCQYLSCVFYKSEVYKKKRQTIYFQWYPADIKNCLTIDILIIYRNCGGEPEYGWTKTLGEPKPCQVSVFCRFTLLCLSKLSCASLFF